MGQTLSRKPISQNRSFATLNTASNPFAPQPQQQTQSMSNPSFSIPIDPPFNIGNTQVPMDNAPSSLGNPLGRGFQRFRQPFMGQQE